MKNFLRIYIMRFRLKSIEVWDMKQCLEDYINENVKNASEVLDKIKWDYWLYKEGMIGDEYVNFARNSKTEAVEALVECYKNGDENCNKTLYRELELDLKIIFVKRLLGESESLDKEKVTRIRNELNITYNNKNPEILSIWFTVLVRFAHELDVAEVKTFLGCYGRLKFIRPIYISFAASARDFGLKIYKELRPRYHPIAQKAIDQILGYTP
eukprot:TRINITY_DN11933_c0_g1_i1.p1 TRINITY_DN11933_c0_g1~~TRINITY_DN11933_c0_g1_i1.p1  ORF type:complete len:212 (+),score=60.80 TRINITY_DN11933_c0_g1_i1:190-825(+)